MLSAGQLVIPAGGAVNLSGGLLSAGSITLSGGSFNFTTGTLQFTGSNFVVGSTGVLGDTVNLTPGQRIVTTGANQAVINTGALLQMGGGTLAPAGGITNNGQINLASLLSRISGGVLINNALIDGSGRIDNVLSNNAIGIVRAAPPDHVTFTAATNVSAGTIQLLGGIAEFTQTLINSGRITGRGTLFTSTLTNNGTMLFSGGPADVYGNVTNAAAAKVLVTGGSNTTFYGNVSNNAATVITVDPASVVTFLGTFTGGTVTGLGTQIYRAPGSFITIDGNGAAVVDETGQLTATHIRSASLSLIGPASISSGGGTSGTSRVNTLSINGATNAWNTTLNLNDNALVIDYTGASPLATVQNQIKTARNGGAWNGNGITSSLANASIFALGYAEASAIPGLGGSFAGQPTDASTVLVKYTYYGDANLDGKVNGLDFNALASHFGQTGKFWSDADANYDGTVNGMDFNSLAINFGKTLPASGPEFATLVPEPASIPWVAAVASFVLARLRFKTTRPIPPECL